MSSAEISKEINDLENKRAELATHLEAIIGQFQAALPSIAEAWIRREVERRIDDHPEQVEALGVEKLRSLKQKVNHLIASLPVIVKAETSDKSDWPHYRAPDGSGYTAGKEEPFFNKAYRNVISHVGSILSEYGLLTEQAGHELTWKKILPRKFRYSINPGLEDLSIEPVEQFTQVQKEYETLLESLDTKKKELVKAKARELWDSA